MLTTSTYIRGNLGFHNSRDQPTVVGASGMYREVSDMDIKGEPFCVGKVSLNWEVLHHVPSNVYIEEKAKHLNSL